MEYRDENKRPNEISLINKIKADLHFRYLTIKYTRKHLKLSEFFLKIATQSSNIKKNQHCKLTKLIVCDGFH